jgi:suppressor of ftsI
LTVSPQSPGDDVLTMLAKPGERLHYHLVIPRNQEPGLYWYHSHADGESMWQVTSGLSGALVIEGLQAHEPILRAMRERLLVVRDVQRAPDPSALVVSRTAAPNGDADAANPVCAPDPAMETTVNGTLRPTIAIAPGERQLFRVVNASGARYLDLRVPGERLRVAALDGYALDAYPGSPSFQDSGDVVLAPGQRADFIVTGLATPTTLQTDCYYTGPAGDPAPEATLADLRDLGQAPLPKQSPLAVQPLPRNTALLAPSAIAAHRTIRFSEDANGFYLDGRAFAMGDPPAIVARSGTVEAWTLLNETDEVHAFHIHQVHFVVDTVEGIPQTPRHWVDEVTVPPRVRGPHGDRPGVATILVDFRDPVVRGIFVYHCHLLDHEDRGMMAKIRVL